MHARAIDEAQARLFELHNDEIQDIALGGVALAASLASTALFPALAVPLFVGGVTMEILGIRALWRHWDLLDRLADDCDAHAIRQVREYAARDTRMARRVHFAALARSCTRTPDASIAEIADELEALARELEDTNLELDPAAALACRRLLTEPTASPLFGDPVVSQDIRSCISRIRAGFRPSDQRSRGLSAGCPARQ